MCDSQANGLSREDIVGIIHSEQRAKYGRLWQDLGTPSTLVNHVT